MSSYVSQYPPAVEFDPAYKKFFEDFYATSDAAEAHEEYVQYFTKDATLVMVSKRVVGREVFPFGPKSDEVMLYGTVKYGFKAGGEASKDWAARAHLVKEDGGKVKMNFYQVYLVRHSPPVRVRICGLEANHDAQDTGA
ncbi:uncharacterized protein J4E87_007530 [Alternaria ethzedia]|uniref:uncharacterized protein n=1 Tax=Alternaria ethzedia TaxID=181014 RepID=UPI0020C40194|nr:uncharacterized protein J4E87_007530 [Alternaria ethzedia]KAI4619280.1 hypothetical protein J4E87_007530 [Alternaria ethzedia]